MRDLDEHRQAFLARASIAKNEKPVWLALNDVLFDAVLAQLPPRVDRDLDAGLFPGFKGANLRTSINRRGVRFLPGPSHSTRWSRKGC